MLKARGKELFEQRLYPTGVSRTAQNPAIHLSCSSAGQKRNKHRFQSFFITRRPGHPAAKNQLLALNSRFRRALASHFQEKFNAKLYEMLLESPPVDIEAKRSIAAWVREQLDLFTFSIEHPKEGYPCIMVALSGNDGNGLFTLESREGRKRSHSTADLHALLDLKLINSPPILAKRSQHSSR